MILSSQNLSISGNYLRSLPGSDASQRYYNGEVYKSTFFSRLRLFFTIGGVINELKQFYPYQRVIAATAHDFEEKSQEVLKNSLLISAGSIFMIFNLARRGYILPIFSKYGKVFGTHRILRHYGCALFLPYILLSGNLRWKYLNHVEHFWAIHSRRMNNKMTQDPSDTIYPPEMKTRNFSSTWRPTFVDPVDLPTKWENQTDFFNAPGFQIAEYQPEETEAGSQEADQIPKSIDQIREQIKKKVEALFQSNADE